LEDESLGMFFNPRSVAVIGASREPGKIGHEILRNVRLSGYKGNVYPINPNASSQTIEGFKCYRSLSDIRSDKGSSAPPSVDLAVIAIPAHLVRDALERCAKEGVRGVIVITSGFSEIGRADLEAELVSVARSSGMRLIGPNTFGVYSAKCGLNCTFGPKNVLAGKTAFITQSGALGLALMAWTTEENYGVSAIVSIGNKADVDDSDLVSYFSKDEGTKTILIYMEGLKDGKKFYDAARRATRIKPVIVIKSGRSRSGARAASSHTGSIAGQDVVYSAAFREAGVMRADTMTQAFDWLQAINENPVPRGEGVIIVTNGGGLGVLAADNCEEKGMPLMDISARLRSELSSAMPSFGSLANPIDLTAIANDDTYHRVLETLMDSAEVNGVIALFCQTANIDPSLVADAMISTEGIRSKRKPVTAGFIGGHLAELAYKRMLEKKFAAYPTAERAVDGMYALVERYRELHRVRDEYAPPSLRQQKKSNAADQRRLISSS
jgi:acetyl-CoA synthetase (ADP-forming)